MVKIVENNSQSIIGVYEKVEEAIEATNSISSGNYLVLDEENNILYQTLK